MIQAASLGYKTSSSYTYEDVSGVSLTYSDPDWNWIGNSWSETDNNSGETIASGSNFRATVTNDSNVEYVQEVGSSVFGDDEYSFVFNYALNEDGTLGEFLGGSETFNGVTTEWGPNWTLIGQTTDLNDSSLVAVTSEDADALPFDGTAAFSRTETMDWGGENETIEEVTYFDSAGNVLGYANVNVFTQDGDGYLYKHELQ